MQVDSDGKQITLKRNHNLRQHVLSTYNQPLEDYHSDIKVFDNILVGIGLNGKVTAWSGEMTCLAETSLRPEEASADLSATGTAATATSSGETSAASAASYTVVKAIHTDSMNPSDISNVPEDALYRRGRMVVLALDLVTESLSPDAIAALQKKQKKGDPPLDTRPKRSVKYRIVVLDLFADCDSKVVKFDRVHDLYLDTTSEYVGLDANFALHDYIQIDLAEDGRLCTLVINQSPAICHIYDFDQAKDCIPSSHSAPLASIAEEGANLDATAAAQTTPMKAPALVAIWKVDKVSDVKVIVKQMLIVTPKPTILLNPLAPFNPLPPKKAATDASAAAPPAPEGEIQPNPTVEFRRDVYDGVKVYAILTEANYVPVLRLGVKPLEPPKPVITDPKAKDKGKKEAEVVLSPAAQCPCVIYEEKRWNFSSSVTAWSCFGETFAREYIVLGLANGKVTMWDMKRNNLLATLGNHPAAITAIDTVYDQQVKAVNVICGALDGTLTFYSNRNLDQVEESTSLDFVFAPSPLSSTKFIDFRGDVHNEALLTLNFLPVSVTSDNYVSYVIFCQYSGGHIALYDASNLSLMSTLATEEKIDYDPVQSIFLHGRNLPVKRFIIVDPEPEPVVEAAPPAKKGAAPAAPVEEVVVEEPVVVEEVKDIVEVKSIDVEDVKNIFHSGLSTRQYSVFFSSRLNYLYTLNERGEKPYLTTYRMDLALQEHQDRAKEPTGFVWKVAPLPRRRSNTGMSTVSKASRMKGIPSTANSVSGGNNINNSTSFKALKLTEERLAQHERQFDSSAQLKRLSGWSSLAFANKQDGPTVDPTALVKRDLLASKKERNNSNPKNKLNKTITNLASLCSM